MYHQACRLILKIIQFFFIFISAVLLLSACGQKSVRTEIEVLPVDSSGVVQLLESHRGNYVFLNIWATWCQPCIEEFPDLIRLADNYKDQNIKFIALSVDYPDEVDSKIKPFLQSADVNFPVYVQNFKQQDKLINLLNPDWNGAIPATLIFDPNGNRIDFIVGKQNFSDFSQKIENLLLN